MNIVEQKYESIEDAACALAIDMADNLREAISTRGQSLIAVSGGNTPQKVFKYLRKEKVDWSKVAITLTDERWVPNDHQESNEKLVRTYLLKYLSQEVKFIPFYRDQRSLKEGVKSCERRLKTLQLPFDAVYLGIGTDGHFASLFPQDEALNVTDSFCVGIEATSSRLARVSLTKSSILNARKIYLLFSGEDKLITYRGAKTPGLNDEIPLRIVLSQNRIPVKVYYAL